MKKTGKASAPSFLSGFTLTELVIGLAIGAVIVLMIGVISSTGIGSYERLRKEAQVYSDIFYGFNLIQRNVRNMAQVKADPGNNTITAGNFTFSRNGADFIYTDSADNSPHIILGGISNFSFTVSPPTANPPNHDLFTVRLTGDKDKVAFDLTTEVTARN